MDPARVKAWRRFFDGVVANGAAWPPHLWFAAVEDGLAAALGPQSPLLEAFRRDVAELLALERAASGSWHDEQRIAQLEAQIQASLHQADEIVRGPAPGALPALRPETSGESPLSFELSHSQPFWTRALRASTFGLLLVGSGLLGGVWLYDARLARQVGDEVGRHVASLQESIARAEGGLAAGIGTFEQESLRVSRLQGELAAEASELEATVRDSLQAMTKLRETAVAELEERLAQETGAVAEMMGRLQERGAALNRGLDQVSADLATLEQRLPGLGRSFAALDETLEDGQASLAQTVEGMRALQSRVPELSTWVDAEHAGVEEAFADKRQLLDLLEARIAGIGDEVEASGERLAAFDRTVEEQLERAKSDGLTLQRTVEDLRTSSDVVATLVATTESELEAARAQTQERIGAMLTEVAEKADLAVMRGDDVLKRAQAEATRRVKTASLEALDTLDRLRAEELAALAEQIAVTRTELEQTRGGLVASWQRMDRFVAERHNQLLAELDRYAQTMEARVQQLLEALNVMVAQTENKKS